jgi:hypothetical protein
MLLKSKKILSFSLGLVLIVATAPLFSAFEAHIINVTATIDNPVLLEYPNGGEILTIGETYTIEWTANENLPRLGNVSGIDLYYSTDGGNTYPNEIIVDETNDGSYNWEVPDSQTTQARIMVLAHYNGTDAPNQTDYSDENFEISHTVALWHFDENSGDTAFDETENNNDGTLMPASPAWVSGYSGSALEFDGIDDYLEVPDSNSLDIPDEITIEAWVNPDSMDDYESFVHKDNAYVLQFAPGNNGYLRGILWLPSLTILDDTTTQLLTGKWYHVALTYNGSVMKLYVDEIEVASKNVSGNIAVNSNPLYIGYNPRDPSNPDHWWYDGIIDEVRISNIARY